MKAISAKKFAPTALPANRKPRTDWEAIAKDYKAGVVSVRAIAEKHGLTDGAIRKTAKKNAWTRDLSDEIRAKAKADLVRTLVRTVGTADLNDDEIIEEAAGEQVSIIRTHQTGIRNGQNVCAMLMAELTAGTMSQEEINDLVIEETKEDENGKRRAAMLKMLGLQSRAQTAVALSNAMKTFITLQRQAHGIDANPDAGRSDIGDLLAAIDGHTAGLPFTPYTDKEAL